MALQQILTGSIDCALIDKSKIKEVTKKDGTVAKYLDIQIFVNDEQDQYNNIASIAVNQSKEESERKDKKTYLGNLKRTWGGAPKPTNNESNNDFTPDEMQLPF